jgi:hypothetical protein
VLVNGVIIMTIDFAFVVTRPPAAGFGPASGTHPRAKGCVAMPTKHTDASNDLPRDPHIDSTLGLLRDGYEFISKRAQAYPRSGVCLGNVRQEKSIAEEEPELPVACPARLRRSK